MPYADGDVSRAVEKVLRVPDSYRQFSESVTQARQLYRINATLLDHLLDRGLPRRGAGEAARFDDLDLTNIAIHLRLPTPRLFAMRWWPTALCGPSGEPALYRVGIRSGCETGACDGCSITLADELEEVGGRTVLTPDDPHLDGYTVVQMRRNPVRLPPEVTKLFAPIEHLEWHLMPDSLAEDRSFMFDTGLADCRGVSRYLCDAGLAAGMQARCSFGLMVTVPFSAFHFWSEFLVDGRWLPADPLFLKSLAELRVVDPKSWPPEMSPAGALWRISEFYVPLARHNRLPAWASLPTERIEISQGEA